MSSSETTVTDTQDPISVSNQGESLIVMETSEEGFMESSFENEGQFQNMGSISADAGTIIFSPQDMFSNPYKKEKTKPINEPYEIKSDSQFTCTKCGKVFTSEKTLRNHMSVHSEFKSYPCPHCDKSFARKLHLQGHLAMHGNTKQYECHICHQRFSRPDCVKVHMRLHDKSKCVYCQVCQKAFLTVGALNIHLRIHRGEKPFKCHICNKCFTQKTHLISHIKRHSKIDDAPMKKKLGPHMFKCGFCSKSFIRLSDYEAHVHWNHGAIAEHNTPEIETTPRFPAPMQTMWQRNSRPIKEEHKPRMSTTSTQTDVEGGHVIIPRKYQGQSSACSTPRHDEDYETEMFDEGMDRNCSSDEEESENTESERKIIAVSSSTGTNLDSAKDAEFDAVVKGESTVIEKKKIPQPTMFTTPRDQEIIQYSDTMGATHDSESSRSGVTYAAPQISTRPRGRPKTAARKLPGATQLHLIRKSMMTFLSEEAKSKQKEQEEVDEQSITLTEQEDGAAVAYLGTAGDGRKRRNNRAKQHGKDFVCTMKGCELCNPSKENAAAPILLKVEKTREEKKDITQIDKQNDEKHKAEVETTRKRILNIYDNLAQEHKINKWSKENTQKTTSYAYENESYIQPVSSTMNEIISPPVEVQSFCIPTYSCKLCNREFRFEGKLHRHIESVHQNKRIFSADVKPGRGNYKNAKINYNYMEENGVNIGGVEYILPGAIPKSKREDLNPEIAALRSEWSDDDAEEEEENENVHSAQSIPNSIQYMGREKLSPSKHGPFKEVEVIMNRLTGIIPEKIRSKVLETSEERAKYLPGPSSTPKSVESTLDVKCHRLLQKLFDSDLLLSCGINEEHVSVVLGRILQHYGVKMIEDYGQGQYEVLKYNLWRLIEWKVTMEQMEEFYTEGKSVEEMMDDIMNNRVPLVSHIPVSKSSESASTSQNQQNTTSTEHPSNSMQSIEISESNQVVLSQVANVLGGQLNIADGVTQVVLAQDLSPEMLQGAHIVTIDPTTGQVLSQVTADQVILADNVGDIGTQVVELNTAEGTYTPQTVSVQSSCPTTSITQPIMSQVILNHGESNVQISTTTS